MNITVFEAPDASTEPAESTLHFSLYFCKMPFNIMPAFLRMSPKWLFFSFRTKTVCSTRSSSDCHMPFLSHRYCDCPSNIWRRIQICLWSCFIQLPLTSFPGYKYSPQPPSLQSPLILVLPSACETKFYTQLSFISVSKSSWNSKILCIILHLAARNIDGQTGPIDVVESARNQKINLRT